MRTWKRVRTWVRWTLTVLLVVLVGVWIASGFFTFGFTCYWPTVAGTDLVGMKVSRGFMELESAQSRVRQSLSSGVLWKFHTEMTPSMYFWRWDRTQIGTRRLLTFPAWVPPLLVAIPPTLLWRTRLRARRRGPHACVKCGYDTSGLVGVQTCPECGTAFEVAKSQVSAS